MADAAGSAGAPTETPVTALVLAAGKGTRMKSDVPKVLHELAGKPLLWHVLRSLREAGVHDIIVVVGHQAELVERRFSGDGVAFVRQQPQKGTGHAVMVAEPLLRHRRGTLLVGCGDTPLLRPSTLRRLFAHHHRTGAAATVLTAHVPDPTGYGRIVRSGEGAFTGIVEERDADPEQRRIGEINTGTYCFRVPDLLAALPHIRPDNAQGEYYLTDVVGMLAARGAAEAVPFAEGDEWRGVNTRADLARAEALMQRGILEHWATNGVTVRQPEATRVDVDVRLAPGVVLEPGSRLLGRTEVEGRAVIGPDAELIDCWVGEGAKVAGVRLRGCRIEPKAVVGPGAVLPDGSLVGSEAKVGRWKQGGCRTDEA